MGTPWIGRQSNTTLSRVWMWAGFPLVSVQQGDATYFTFSDSGGIEFLTNFSHGEGAAYVGVPTSAVLPSATTLLSGVFWMKSDPEEGLLTFAIKNGTHFLGPHLRNI